MGQTMGGDSGFGNDRDESCISQSGNQIVEDHMQKYKN